MENSVKNQIITLGNGNKYFVLEELNHNSKTYDFLLNIDDENNIEIVYQDVVNSKLILREVKDEEEKKEVALLFKEIIDKK